MCYNYYYSNGQAVYYRIHEYIRSPYNYHNNEYYHNNHSALLATYIHIPIHITYLILRLQIYWMAHTLVHILSFYHCLQIRWLLCYYNKRHKPNELLLQIFQYLNSQTKINGSLTAYLHIAIIYIYIAWYTKI